MVALTGGIGCPEPLIERPDGLFSRDRYHTLGEIFQGLECVSGARAPRLSLPYTLTMAYAWIEEWLGRLTGKEVLMNREGIRTTHAKLKVTSEKAVRELGVSFRVLVSHEDE